MVKHLQDQLKELQGAKDALAISRTREEALQKQVVFLMQVPFAFVTERVRLK